MRFALAEETRGEVFNLASGQETTIKELIEKIGSYFGFTGEISWQPERAADVRRHLSDVQKAVKAIGPVAPTKLEDGLKITLDWYRGRNAK